MNDPILARLDDLIRIAREAGHSDRYLNADGVAILLGYSYTYTRDHVVHRPDFPAALRMGDGRGRWLRSKVLKWAGQNEQRKRSA